MKKTGKIVGISLGVIVLLLLVVMVAANSILANRLSETLKQYVVPGLEEQLGVSIDFESAKVQVLGGYAEIRGVKIGNPAGFDEPEFAAMSECRVTLKLKSLIQGGIIELSAVHIDGLELMLVRNAEGLFNLALILDRIEAEGAAGPCALLTVGAAVALQPGTDIPKILVRGLSADAIVRFTDHSILKDPLQFTFDLVVDAVNLATFERQENAKGMVSIKGALLERPEACIVDLVALVGPMSNVDKLDVEIEGTIRSIDVELIKPYTKKLDFECEELGLELGITCKDSMIDEDESLVTFWISDISLLGDLKKKAHGIGKVEVDRLLLPVPVQGTLFKPEFADFGKALRDAVLDYVLEHGELILRELEDEASTELEKLKEKGRLELKKVTDDLDHKLKDILKF